MKRRRLALTLTSALMLVVAAACHKKAPPPPPPPAPAPAPTPSAPSVNFFTAEPDTISSGQPSSLRWSVSNASSVQINQGIGSVSPDGRRAVYPTTSTTYTLTATNAGGNATAVASITVNTPPPPPAAPKQEGPSVQEILTRQVQDIHFDYDKSDIRPVDQPILQADATALKTIFSMDPNFIITVEGHCDERGSAEYNLALGDRRASATKDALIALGVPGDKLKTISYGKERPLCTDATEECYARNRRAHFSAGQ